MIKKLLIILFLLLLIALSSAISADPKGAVPGQFIVKLSENAKPDILRKSLASNIQLSKASSSTIKSQFTNASVFNRYFILTAEDTALTEGQLLSILGSQNIESIEPDYFCELFEYPTDSLFEHQWYLHNTGQPYYGVYRYDGYYNDIQVLKFGTAGIDVGLNSYYMSPPVEFTRVVVAIVDTGVDYLHPELEGQIWKNEDEIPNNNIDDDHNGYVDDTLGIDIGGDIFDYFNPVSDNEPTDTHGHGTHIAGIVSAKINQRGVVGVAPNSLIMPVKIAPNNTAGFTTSTAAEGLIYAVNNGAQVINISWGTPFESTILRDAISFARANNVFVCIAPGNFSSAERFYPAGFDSTFVVAASNSYGYLTYFTSFGAHVDVAAPGEDILSLKADGVDLYARSGEPGVHIVGNDSLYLLADGTSMATPIVAGAAALLLSISPDLTLDELEQLIIEGAVDMVDPFRQGDTLIGYDTLSGHGTINIDQSIALLDASGLAIKSPQKRLRYTDNLPIKALPRGGYSSAWVLYYSLGEGNNNWILLSSGVEVPQDSILYILDETFSSGLINLKLTDTNGKNFHTEFFYVRNRLIELTSPVSGEDEKYDIEITGSAYGPVYDSMLVYYKHNGTQNVIMSSTSEYFDTFIYNWKVSGIDTGLYNIYLFGFYGEETIVDSVEFNIINVFATGWPQTIGTKTTLTPVVCDLNHDDSKEIIVPSSNGLYAFTASGQLLEGFPVLPEKDMRSIPSIYDIDRDGEDEIIITNDTGLYVVKFDGTFADGWPQYCRTGMIAFGYGYPNPTVAQLGIGEDSAIVFINTLGQIMAYEFNGDSYFYSLEGLFALFNPRISDFVSNGGRISPFVTSIDMDGNGTYEVVAGYSSPKPYSGVGLFEGRTGLPYMDREDPVIVRESQVFGTALSDFNNDDLMEIITLGNDTLSIPTLIVKTNIDEDYGNFPLSFEELGGWFVSPLTLADLDLDGVAEILFTAFWFDVGHLFIFNSDGTPYRQAEFAPFGAAYNYSGTLGTPIAANLTGDDYPEIIFRSGYLFPGSGPERVHILDHNATPIPDWPTTTPARINRVLSTQFIPVVDDLDSDGKVELIILSDNSDLLVWDFDASYNNGKNKIRFLADNLNSNTFRPVQNSTDIDNNDPDNLPITISLRQNYPNPFNPTTTISFELPETKEITLQVYNILGQKVSTLAQGKHPAGSHKIEFNASNFSSGVYLYRLETDNTSISRKMVLVK